MTPRESFLTVQDAVIAAPGPGQYDPGFAQDIVKGGRTLANKSRRFNESTTFAPGPGTYNLSKKSDWLRSSAKPATAPASIGGKETGAVCNYAVILKAQFFIQVLYRKLKDTLLFVSL